jgi:hypothetical protein
LWVVLNELEWRKIILLENESLSYKDPKTNIVHGGLILGLLPFVPGKNLYKNNWIY